MHQLQLVLRITAPSSSLLNASTAAPYSALRKHLVLLLVGLEAQPLPLPEWNIAAEFKVRDVCGKKLVMVGSACCARSCTDIFSAQWLSWQLAPRSDVVAAPIARCLLTESLLKDSVFRSTHDVDARMQCKCMVLS
jgi:hypothetical protein